MYYNLRLPFGRKSASVSTTRKQNRLTGRRRQPELLEPRRLLSVSPLSISIGPTSPIFSGGTQNEPISITLPPVSVVDKVDVNLLLDDTGSFVNPENFAATVKSIFSNLVTQLQTALPGVDFGFGVTRFEDYAGLGTNSGGTEPEFPTGRPFILNQPIVNNATAAASGTTVAALIGTALDHTAPGWGGNDAPEAPIEALYQIATGAGFDGNSDGNSTGSGAAGALDTQTNPGNSGDVPAFATNVLPASGTLGGVGWRPGALHLVLLAGDTAPAAAFVGATAPTSITGAGGSSVPFSAFQNISNTNRVGPVGAPVVPTGGATVQSTVNALNALGIRVLAMGPNAAPTTSTSASDSPSTWFSAMGRLTGAVDASGNPLVFSTSVPAASLTTAIVDAITTTTTLPIDIGLATTTLPAGLIFTNLTGIVSDVDPGDTANFNVSFAGGSVAGTFDIQFIDVASNAVLGAIPVTVTPPAAALTPPIDILPGCPVNMINLCSNGVLSVAVLGSSTFDATTINTSDLSQIHFGDVNVTARVSPTSATLKDVNCDGRKDLVLGFSVPAIASAGALVAGSTQAEVTGVMQDNSAFRGMDSVVVNSKCKCVSRVYSSHAFNQGKQSAHAKPVSTYGEPSSHATYQAPKVVSKPRISFTPARVSYKPAAISYKFAGVSHKPTFVKSSARQIAKSSSIFVANDLIFHAIGAQAQQSNSHEFNAVTPTKAFGSFRWRR